MWPVTARRQASGNDKRATLLAGGPMSATTIILISGVAVLLVAFVYNGLVRSRLRTREAWSGVDVQLKRRD